MFPVYTGINRLGGNGNNIPDDVPCTHRDKSGMRQYYIAFFCYSNNRNSIFHCFPIFNYMKNINLLVEFRRI